MWVAEGRPPPAPLPEVLELPLGGVTDRSIRIGATMWGTTYRSLERPNCYRVVPIEQAQLERRHAIAELIGRTQRSYIAPVVSGEQRRIDGREYYVIRYQVRPDASLLDVIAHPDPGMRAAYVVRTLRALPAWRAHLGLGLLPMPGDVVFAHDMAYFLALPELPPPGLDAVLEVPARCRHLPAQRVQGRKTLDWRPGADLYALAVGLLDCFFEPAQQHTATEWLERTAQGGAGCGAERPSRLPFWLEKVDACRRAIALLRRAVDDAPEVRTAVDLSGLISAIEACQPRMEPLAAVQELRASGDGAAAAELLDDILLHQPTYELYLLAGAVAIEDQGQPLQAIDHYESAITSAPNRPEAYRLQFDLIAGSMVIVGLMALVEGGGLASRQLDERLTRDFGAHTPAEQAYKEGLMARYLLWRERWDDAARFIYPRLFQGEEYAWWKLDLATGYAEALCGLGDLAAAEQQLQSTKGALAEVSRRAIASPEEIHMQGSRLSTREARLYEARQGGAR